MSTIYEIVGRFVLRAVWWRFGSQIRLAGAAFALLTVVGGYLVAQRKPPEG
jgi:hypothetical protein